MGFQCGVIGFGGLSRGKWEAGLLVLSSLDAERLERADFGKEICVDLKMMNDCFCRDFSVGLLLPLLRISSSKCRTRMINDFGTIRTDAIRKQMK